MKTDNRPAQKQPEVNSMNSKANAQKDTDYKAQMNDIIEKSNKLDRLMEERSKIEVSKPNAKNSFEKKPAKLVVQEQTDELGDSYPDPDKIFANSQLKSKIGKKDKTNTAIRQITDEQIVNGSNLTSSKRSMKQNETDDLLVSESMGYDMSVGSDALEEFDYVESIENG